jgi:hypothetical protein
MLVRKSRISHLILKEKSRERRRCEQQSQELIARIKEKSRADREKLEKEFQSELKRLEQEKNREIRSLKRELERNYALYQEIRKREMHLNDLTGEIENVVELMVVKVQESLQPFYRTRSKIETIKRQSDRRHEKVESILTAVK